MLYFSRSLISWILLTLWLFVSPLLAGEQHSVIHLSANGSELDLTTISKKYQVPAKLGLQIPSNTKELHPYLNSLPTAAAPNLTGDHQVLMTEVITPAEPVDFVLSPFGTVLEHIRFLIYDETELVQVILTGEKYQNEFEFHYGKSVELKPNYRYWIVTELKSGYFYAPIKILVQEKQQFVQQVKIETVWIILCLGIGIALAIYNLFIYIQSKDIAYFYYAAFTACWIFAWAQMLHMPKELFGYYNQPQWHWVGFLLLPLTNNLFLIYFLKIKKTMPVLCNVAIGVGVVSMMLIPVAYYSPGDGMLITTLITGVNMLIGITAGVRSYRSGFKPAMYFLLAYFVMVLPNMVNNFINLGVFPDSNLNFYILGLMGTTGDALILAFALAYKFRLISLESEKLNKSLESTVQQRTAELRQVALQLEDAGEAKSRFLATTSHEMRTPLTAIIGYAESILHGDISQKEHERALNVISKNGQHLLAIINDILDVSKIEANQLLLDKQETQLVPLVEDVCSSVSSLVEQKDIVFEIKYSWPLPESINVDPTRLKQVLYNLIHNAVKFTEQGSVCVSVYFIDGQLFFEVMDTGIGMSDDQKEVVFEVFRQADSSMSRKYGGTGLGLNISRSLADAMSGEIVLTSELGKGSTFLFSIPLTGLDNVRWLKHQPETAADDDTEAPQQLPKTLLSGTVLLADDHEDNRALLSLLLARCGLTVLEADNGKQAFELAMDNEPELVLMDIQMPVMDGETATKMLRDAGFDGCIIALTANVLSHEVNRYITNGFDDHLAKPIDRNVFVTKVAQCFEQQNEAAEPQIDSGIMEGLSAKYLEKLPERILIMENALAQQDFDTIQKQAHAIKGSAGMFGLDDLGDQAKELESAIKASREPNSANQKNAIPSELCQAFIDFSNKLIKH